MYCLDVVEQCIIKQQFFVTILPALLAVADVVCMIVWVVAVGITYTRAYLKKKYFLTQKKKPNIAPSSNVLLNFILHFQLIHRSLIAFNMLTLQQAM